MCLNFDIIDKLFYTLINIIIVIINIIIVAVLNFYFNRKLKKQTARFSLYNEIQIEALRKIYKLLTSFKFITLQIRENDKKYFDFYKKISDKWLRSFLELTNTLSQEKYILPKDIKSSYTITIIELHSLRDYLVDNTKLKGNFETHFDGLEYNQIIKPYADEDYIRELQEKINKVESENLFNSLIKKIEILRNKIELEFEKMK